MRIPANTHPDNEQTHKLPPKRRWKVESEQLRLHVRRSFHPDERADFDLQAFLKPFQRDVKRPFMAGNSLTSVLHSIAKDGEFLNVAKKAVELGANLNAQEAEKTLEGVYVYGNTPLIWAIANARYEMAKLLIRLGAEKGANFDLQDAMRGNTALHLAIAKGYRGKSVDEEVFDSKEIAHALIQAGAGVSLPDRNGNTPLHLAALRRDFDLCELLIQNGANRNAVNAKGQQPFDLLNFEYDDAYEFLEKQAVAFMLEPEMYGSQEKLARLQKLLRTDSSHPGFGD